MHDQPLQPYLDDNMAQPLDPSAAGYKQQISRANPGCIVFLLDQSGSMIDGIAGSARPSCIRSARSSAPPDPMWSRPPRGAGAGWRAAGVPRRR